MKSLKENVGQANKSIADSLFSQNRNYGWKPKKNIYKGHGFLLNQTNSEMNI